MDKVCKWCGVDISHMGPKALFCKKQCGAAYRRNIDPEPSREAVRKWRRLNPNAVRVAAAKRYAKDKEKILASNREWHKSNPQKVREKRRKWVKENPEKARDSDALYYNNRSAAASTLSLAHTISQIKAGGLTNGDN